MFIASVAKKSFISLPTTIRFLTKIMTQVPSIPVAIDDKNIQSGAVDVLRVVRPEWTKKYTPTSIKFKVFTDGLSNKLVGFFVDENPEDIVIVKVFGTNTDMMIDRKAEIETMRLLHDRKCGAELYATFENGICYEYVNGSTLEVSDCQDPEIYPLVAAEMAHMHSSFALSPQNKLSFNNNVSEKIITNGHGNQYVKEIAKSAIWDKIIQFNKLAEEAMRNNPELQNRLESVGVRPKWAEGAIKDLRKILESAGMPVTFCHNDLIPRNIVYDEKRRRVTFIDVEYAMPNYPAFDVANHFLEFAGVSNMDYSKCPDKTFRLKWIDEYLKDFQLEGVKVSSEEFNQWVDLCTPASHLFWGLWGIYQACHSTIDFDYVKYVGLRFSEFRKCMEKLETEQNGFNPSISV